MSIRRETNAKRNNECSALSMREDSLPSDKTLNEFNDRAVTSDAVVWCQ
jgi:hypothetical protein